MPGLATMGTAASFLQVGRAEQTLAEIETTLAGRGRTLGGLPPWGPMVAGWLRRCTTRDRVRPA